MRLLIRKDDPDLAYWEEHCKGRLKFEFQPLFPWWRTRWEKVNEAKAHRRVKAMMETIRQISERN